MPFTKLSSLFHSNEGASDLDQKLTSAEQGKLWACYIGNTMSVCVLTYMLKHVDDEGMFAYFDSLGVPRHASDIVPQGPIPWSSDDMVTFGRSIREGFFAIQSDHVERLTGRKPIPLREIMMRHRGAWPA